MDSEPVVWGCTPSHKLFLRQRISLTDRTASEISWIGSFQVFLLFVVALPVGKLYDEGYFYHLVSFGSLLYLFS